MTVWLVLIVFLNELLICRGNYSERNLEKKTTLKVDSVWENTEGSVYLADFQ